MENAFSNAAGKECSGGFFHADWPAPACVKTLVSTRLGGYSGGKFGSLNVGAHVGDCPEHVAANRALVQKQVPVPMTYLNQVHGTRVVSADEALRQLCDADASVDFSGSAACAVMTADCLPVLFCDRSGTVVAAAHAGWRGLADGVLQSTVTAMKVAAGEIMAWFGPAIGTEAFEVGDEVRSAFCHQLPHANSAFTDIGEGKYLADIYALAKMVLGSVGVYEIYGGGHCTVLERERFFSYRRDGQTGRMVSAVWLERKS